MKKQLKRYSLKNLRKSKQLMNCPSSRRSLTNPKIAIDVIGLDASDAVLASAKAGIGIEDILEQIVEKVPAPQGDPDAPLKALIFDSLYDAYRGVVAYIRVMEGTVKVGDKVLMMATGKEFEVTEVGVFTPKPTGLKELTVGDVGFLTASIKNVGDTIFVISSCRFCFLDRSTH